MIGQGSCADISVKLNPLPGARDIPLDEELVAVIKRRDIARLKIPAFDADDDLSVLQRRRQGAAVNAQHRHPEHRNQHSQRCNDEQDRDRAPERPVISAFVAQPPALVCKLLRGRQVDGPVCLPVHSCSVPFSGRISNKIVRIGIRRKNGIHDHTWHACRRIRPDLSELRDFYEFYSYQPQPRNASIFRHFLIVFRGGTPPDLHLRTFVFCDTINF